MEVSPEKAPGTKVSSVGASSGGGGQGDVPPPSRVKTLDLDEESTPSSPGAAGEDLQGVAPLGEREDNAASTGEVAEPSDARNGPEPNLDPVDPREPAASKASTTESPIPDVPPADAGATTFSTNSPPLPPKAVEHVPAPDAAPNGDRALETDPSASPSRNLEPTLGGRRRPPISPLAETDPLDAMPKVRPTRPDKSGEYQRTGHPVRDRMLAKAAEASQAPPAASNANDPSNGGAFSALRGMEAELEQLAGPRQKLLSEPVRVGKAVLSPTATLVGITLIGLAAITSLFLLLVKFAPKTAEETAPSAALIAASAEATGGSLVLDPAPLAALPAPVAPPERKREPGPWRIGSAEPGQRLIRGTVGSNPFLRAIQDAGIDKNQAYRIYAALKGQKDLDHCRPKDEFIALINRADKRVTAFEYVVSKEEVYQAKEQDGKLVGKALDLKVNKHRVQGSILVTSAGFAAAAQHAGLEPRIADVVNRALNGHTNVSQFRPGDRLRVVAQEVTVLGEFHRYAGIEALEYLPAEGEPTRVYYHAAKRQYYDAKGRAPGEGGWRSPVRGAPITSKFNPNRLHPILKKKMPHNGTDFGAPTGTPIYAASYGKITKHGNYGPNGNFIAIEHDNGYETGYSHLSRFEPGLKVGDSVKRAQVIGYVGSTGRSTGPHLHFSARKNGAYIDPESLHLDALTVLPSAERAVFQEVKGKYDALLEAVALPPPLPKQLAASPMPAEGSLEEMNGEDAEGEADEVAARPGPPPPQEVATPGVPLGQPGSPSVGAPLAAPVSTALVPAAPGGAFFLSDKDLLVNQPAVDDGEVDE